MSMQARYLAWLGAFAVFHVAATGAVAQAPVAIVEHIETKATGVEFMDYLSPGRVVRLAPDESMVLGYLKSCWRETITAGIVTVGIEQSDVKDGKVERVKVACDAGKMKLSSEQAQKSGTMAFRAPPAKKAAAPQANFTIYGLSPVIEAKAAGRLVIERIDQAGEKHEIDISGPMLVRGAFFDLAKAEKALMAGGLYRASYGGNQAIFKVDQFAKPGATPIIGRLLRLTPES
jgi:hypothetical protein